MFKSKIKMSLVDDYIKISKIEYLLNFLSTCHIDDEDYLLFLCETTNKCIALKVKYEQIFLKIGFVDLSFELLRKQLCSIKANDITLDTNIDLTCLLNEVQNLYNQLTILEGGLSEKMKKLSLNQFEIKLIKNFNKNNKQIVKNSLKN